MILTHGTPVVRESKDAELPIGLRGPFAILLRTQITALASVALLATFVPFCFGQAHQTNFDGTLPYKEAALFKANADLVLVPVIVTDQQDRLVMGLERNNFTVYDGRLLQQICYLSAEDLPMSIGIIVDTSSSMHGKVEQSREAVVQFLRSANPDDEYFLIGIADRPELLTDFTSSVEDIQEQISRRTPEGATALLDAVYLGVSAMKNARHERKVLLIISDGGDNHSRYNTKEVWPLLREAGIPIYAMGIFDDAPRTNAERTGPGLLAALSDVTGGRLYPIHSLKKIADAAAQLAIELRNQCIIGYRPSGLAHDGRWHKISVQVTLPQNRSRLRVYAKRGYYAPAE